MTSDVAGAAYAADFVLSRFGTFQYGFLHFGHTLGSSLVFRLLFLSLAMDLNFKVLMVDGSFVKVRQHAVRAPRSERDPGESRVAQAIGKTKGGLNTNLLALADQNERLVRFSLLPGNAFEAHHLGKLL